MKCYICDTTRPLAGGLWPTTHEAVAVCQHCGAGVCAGHEHRANIAGAPIYCESCVAVVTAAARDAQEPKVARVAAVSASPTPRLAHSH